MDVLVLPWMWMSLFFSGDVKITWQAKVGFGYHFNKFTGTFGFRYLRWNFGSSSDLDNLRIIGPYVGARWTW